MLRPLLVVTLLAALAFQAGCQSKTPPKPIGSTTTTLPTTSRRGTVETKIGMEIRIELPPPEAGHVWTIVQHDPRYLRRLGEIGPPEAETRLTTVVFHALNAGRTQLKFLAVPAHGGPEVLPVDFYDILVVIE